MTASAYLLSLEWSYSPPESWGVIDWFDWLIWLIDLIDWFDWLIWLIDLIDWFDWLIWLIDLIDSYSVQATRRRAAMPVFPASAQLPKCATTRFTRMWPATTSTGRSAHIYVYEHYPYQGVLCLCQKVILQRVILSVYIYRHHLCMHSSFHKNSAFTTCPKLRF
jgi:hypothetical protein